MKQTAVEWFYNQMENLRVKAEITNMDGNDFIIAKVKLLQEAKAMEKEQIVNAFSEGTRMIDVNDEMSAMFNGIIYYGENYEQDKQG